MPETRHGITFNEDGICSACQSYEHRKTINLEKRWKEFEKLCNKYRGIYGSANSKETYSAREQLNGDASGIDEQH